MSAVPPLYLITDAELEPDALIERTRAAIAAVPPGAVAVQLRRPADPPDALLALARALGAVCRSAGAPFFVSARGAGLDVAKQIGADGAHLPEAGDVAGARAALGPGARLGRSCHDRAGLERAVHERVDFAVLGPIGPVPGKGPSLGVDGFARAIAGLALPVYALGGVDAALAPPLRAAGAAGVAVIRAVYAAPDPGAAARALVPR